MTGGVAFCVGAPEPTNGIVVDLNEPSGEWLRAAAAMGMFNEPDDENEEDIATEQGATSA